MPHHPHISADDETAQKVIDLERWGSEESQKIDKTPIMDRHIEALKKELVKFKSAYSQDDKAKLIADMVSTVAALKIDASESDDGEPALVSDIFETRSV